MILFAKQLLLMKNGPLMNLEMKAVEFCSAMKIAHREIIGDTLIEFTHAWYQRDDIPPTMDEALSWRNHVLKGNPK